YSFKRDLARSAWQEFLDQSIVREDGTYVRLAVASVQDLQYAAQMRREQADALNNEAEKYTALAEKMLAKGVSSLDGLTAEDVRGIVKTVSNTVSSMQDPKPRCSPNSPAPL